MTEIPDYLVWVVVGAIVLEGLALVILTYLMWKASEKASAENTPEPGPEENTETDVGVEKE